ncbi:DEAD/DEAH box helicase [Roseicella aquatilis]|uniref:Serine/threonine protein phosphatase n=1 Tax=Roseicella aquatilis TaxID=2527868 RepID=A0A4R4DTQ7_9PROT|nr:DEAD/DEAH box helicase [Roseicella aquatilis]TCZ65412.1 serine/threonine protein phosphatase [Roseicella aquatilis]
MSSEVATRTLRLPGDAEILRGVSRAAFEAGRLLARQRKVGRVAFSADGATIEAEVREWGRKPHTQRITLREMGGTAPAFTGICTCPGGINCKHVVAALIAARDVLPAAPQPAPPAPEPPALPPAIQDWLRALTEAGEGDPEAYPPTLRQRLLYVVALQAGAEGAGVPTITPVSVALRKDGSFGPARPIPIHQVPTARYLRPSDHRILRRIAALAYVAPGAAGHEDRPELLRRIIATGRARWGEPDGPVVTEGPVRPGRLAWRLTPEGMQRPALALDEGLVGFALPEPWYADPATGQLGPVDLGLPAHVAARLLLAPPIPAEAAPLVAAELGQRVAAPAVALPATLDPPELLRGPPVPCLRLTATRLPAYAVTGVGWRRAGGGAPEITVPLARLSFRYGPVRLAFGERPASDVLARKDRLYRLRRDHGGEREAVLRLARAGLESVGYRLAYGAHGFHDAFMLAPAAGEDDPDWLDLLLQDVPALRAEGWEVEIAEDFPIRLIEPEGPLEARLEEGSGIDWLDLQLGVLVEGERVDLVPALVELLATGPEVLSGALEGEAEAFLLPLPDGRLLSLPRARVAPILRALIELFAEGAIDPEAGRIGFTRLDAAELARLEERSGLAWQGGEAIRALGAQLRAAEGRIPPVALPEGFHGALRPYQAQGVAWLQFLRTAGLGGVLADDMGLGKTVQTLAHLAIEQAAGRLDRPALIVCPTSLVPNWRREAARFASGLRVLPLHGPGRKVRFPEIAAHDLVLTTYPLLTRDQEALTAQDWHLVVLDEAQTIKNPNAETTRQALRLRARQRLCLSGTPLQNHLGELWSLFDFLAPGFLGSARSFRSRYRTPIEKHGDAARQAALHRRVRPFLLRRTKEAVATELPPKTEITEPVEMEAAQRAVYEAIRLSMHARVKAAIAEKGLARSGIVILDALLKLRQACCDPRLLAMASAKKAGSAKLDRLRDLLGVLLEEGRRVLVFSQFTSMLALIEAALRQDGIPYGLLTGDTRDREAPVRRFQAGEVPVFLISLKAGGVGLNLTAADTVIHYDPWWNPAVEDQATDRTHRIGQERRVFVHRLITLGTIEEKMELLKERKRALVASVLEAEAGGALALTEADIEELFTSA